MSSIIISSDYTAEVDARAHAADNLRAFDGAARMPARDDEMIGLLRTLQTIEPDKTRWVLGVMSTLPGEGVSTIARCLARIVTRNPKAKVLLCSLPTHATNPNVPAGYLDRAPGEIELNWLPGGQLAIASLAEPRIMNAIACDIDAVSALMRRLSAEFELIVVDLPPASRSVNGPAISKALDGIVLVVEAERTRSLSVRATRKTIDAHGGNVLGVVLNKRRFHIPSFIYSRL
jgi:Mrp family chromosome partitioning ATPase